MRTRGVAQDGNLGADGDPLLWVDHVFGKCCHIAALGLFIGLAPDH